MDYKSRIHHEIEESNRKRTASKILDLIEPLRYNQDISSARRWIWELIQNAKDVSCDDSNVEIEINFDDWNNFLDFKHNGKPFTIANVTYLIEQVSTKDRNPNEQTKSKTTGKFGTGFVTTHLLSEVVELQGIVKEPEEPYRKFEIVLDRSGTTIEEVLSSIDSSLESLYNIDDENSIITDYDSKAYNTCFKYNLNEEGISVAHTGIEDLHTSIFYTLAFVPSIKSVTVTSENTKYEMDNEIREIADGIRIFTINKLINEEATKHYVLVVEKNETSIAIEVEIIGNRICLKEFNENIPRLFCGFPLIGSEDFSFPAIINNPRFNLNEPRNSIFLSDKEKPNIVENKAFMEEAMASLKILLDYGSNENWGKLYLLAQIPTFKEKPWISKPWYTEKIIEPLINKILRTPIVDTNTDQRVAILDIWDTEAVWFPWAPSSELRHKIWNLENKKMNVVMPRECDIDIWYNIKWNEYGRLNLKRITESIEKSKELNEFAKGLKESVPPIEWMNEYFQDVGLDDQIFSHIVNDNYCVIPNQYGVLKKKSEIKKDNEIEEVLKDVLGCLGSDIRNFLKHKEIITTNIDYTEVNQEDVIEHINSTISKSTSESTEKACDLLISIFARDENFPESRAKLFEFSSKVFQFKQYIPKLIAKWDTEIWVDADKAQMRRIVYEISEANNLDGLKNKMKFESLEIAKEWLISFIAFATSIKMDNVLDLKKTPILPDQNGDFFSKDDMFLDDGKIDEKLKDISYELGHDFREKLLDLDVYLSLPENRIKSEVNVAEEILRRIPTFIAEYPKSESTKKVFNKLLIWFRANKEKAGKLFNELYYNKHKLYDDDEIAENIQRAEALVEILSEYGLPDMDSLKKRLEASYTQLIIEQKEVITQETLASLGISSFEEFEEALKDPGFANNYIHTSTHTIDMFRFAQEKIQRAKENIISYLGKHPDYDFTLMEELAPTVLGGIYKGQSKTPITIVARPSDNGFVIIYSPSERDCLDYNGAELWVENGRDKPQHLTLGKILKKTGINKIPLINNGL